MITFPGAGLPGGTGPVGPSRFAPFGITELGSNKLWPLFGFVPPGAASNQLPVVPAPFAAWRYWLTKSAICAASAGVGNGSAIIATAEARELLNASRSPAIKSADQV